jgi:hypothetical protein
MFFAQQTMSLIEQKSRICTIARVARRNVESLLMYRVLVEVKHAG